MLNYFQKKGNMEASDEEFPSGSQPPSTQSQATKRKKIFTLKFGVTMKESIFFCIKCNKINNLQITGCGPI